MDRKLQESRVTNLTPESLHRLVNEISLTYGRLSSNGEDRVTVAAYQIYQSLHAELSSQFNILLRHPEAKINVDGPGSSVLGSLVELHGELKTIHKIMQDNIDAAHEKDPMLKSNRDFNYNLYSLVQDLQHIPTRQGDVDYLNEMYRVLFNFWEEAKFIMESYGTDIDSSVMVSSKAIEE